MVAMYDCSGCRWLNNLYSLRKKWCPTFSKKDFSGGCCVREGKGENHKCFKGNVEMAFPSVSLLKHAKPIYTIEAYRLYMMKRWSKGVKEIQSNELIVENGMKDIAVCSLVQRIQMGRKMNALLTASQMNREARLICDECFSKLKDLSELTNLEVQRSTKAVPQNVDAILSGTPLCMNGPYGGSSSQDNIVPTLMLLSNSNPNDQSLCQSTIVAVGCCPPFYFDLRAAGCLTPMMF
ncbi:hypothetical protein Cgig2_010258 [Carnegiea gigantea]|uniref:Protein FAR1-RELATED SEQUENCE n=1 Tax=Carnegiea gigantea TaxID=171969 RepID=A0A9Q1QC17_9CARY|nr:hypothetical protein Cgig2_010258 [Carnegiea gigantea]